MSARVHQVEKHVHGHARYDGREPDRGGRAADPAVFGEIFAVREYERRNSEDGGDGREHDVEQEEYQIDVL